MSNDAISALAAEGILKVFRQQENAWSEGDAQRYAETFAEDCTCTNIFGDTYIGRQAVAFRMSEILSGMFKGSKLELNARRMALVQPDVAAVDIDACVHSRQSPAVGVQTADGRLRTAMLQVLVCENGAWRVAAFHNVQRKSS